MLRQFSSPTFLWARLVCLLLHHKSMAIPACKVILARASLLCHTMIQKVMLRKSLFKFGGSHLAKGCPKSFWAPVVCWCIGKAETDLCSREAEFHWSRSGNKHHKRWLSFLFYLLAPLRYLCVYIMEKFIMPLAVSYFGGHFCVVWDMHEEKLIMGSCIGWKRISTLFV